MTKKLKIVMLSTFGSLTVAGLAAGSIIGGIGVISDSDSKVNQNSSIVVQSQKDKGFKFNLERQTYSIRNGTDIRNSAYKLKIMENTNREGTIFLINDNGERLQETVVRPGDLIRVGFTTNKGYEHYTIRELKLYGADENHFVPSREDGKNKGQFLIQLPTVEESIDPTTGNSWLYKENVDIKLVPSFIVSNIGQGNTDVEWEHGAYQDSLNGYVYQMTEDSTWSSLKGNLYETFENKDKTEPIDIYFYLNGHTLTIDEDITGDNYFPSGWNINFYNNRSDTKDKEHGWGKITASNQSGYDVKINGSVTFGYGVEHSYIIGTNGIKILQPGNEQYNTIITNRPK